MKRIIRRQNIISGQVQGVGFRPFVYRIALEAGLTGFVKNTPEGVVVEIQGAPEAAAAFERDLTEKLPPLARIVSLERTDLATVSGEAAFRIEKSQAGAGHRVLISPDIAACPDCLKDMSSPDNRRFGYPFTNCTNCGPRYTITKDIPYDREGTTMACFPMCPDCRAEYENPLDRRFHAQPNACPVCGPKVWLADREGKSLAEGDAALVLLAAALARGEIAAIKGLGGFHLACDATSDTAAAKLRARKRRPSKALAVMVPDLETAERLAELDDAERTLLTGDRRPIVLTRKKPGPLSGHIAPDTEELGLMTPYTPLHHVLFAHLADALGPDNIPALVMTSGNLSSEPIALGNREAFSRLGGVADLFLFHNRDILIRTDDSVVRTVDGVPQFLRRARGYTPSPVDLADGGPSVVGLGPLLKCTVCLTKGDQAFVGQHIGDLENLETFGFYEEILAHLQKLLRTSPQALAADLHPDYMSTRFALDQDALPVFRVQHHVAHIQAALAENKWNKPAVGLALDGTGLGDDGTLWGGECLYLDPETPSYARAGTFSQIRLPGGEAAIRHPWRIALSCLHALGRADEFPGVANPAGREKEAAMVVQLLDKDLNCPATTSCGRLFDAMAALLGLCGDIEYEGQAAVRLERIQDMGETGAYDCPLLVSNDGGPMRLDTLALFGQAADDLRSGAAPGRIGRRFHLGLIKGLTRLTAEAASQSGVEHAALSGGVMQNRTMAALLPKSLAEAGLSPLMHKQIPPNDACISLGQAVYGRRLLISGVPGRI